METIVDTDQSTFVLGRNWTDNIILSHELVKGIWEKGNFQKIYDYNMKKTYDS